MTVERIFKKYVSVYLYLGLFFETRKNSGLTQGQNSWGNIAFDLKQIATESFSVALT